MTEQTFDGARKRLWNELVMLHDLWAQYEELYKHSVERIEMLNRCAGWFFGSHQRVLLREIILCISRLTDAPRVGRFDNLTLDVLLSDPALEQRPEVRTELQAAIEAVRAASSDIRRHRDKYIAHLDYATAVSVEADPVPRIPKTTIPEIVRLMEHAYNVHGGALRDAYSIFDLSPTGSAGALLEIVEGSSRWAQYKEYRARRDREDETES